MTCENCMKFKFQGPSISFIGTQPCPMSICITCALCPCLLLCYKGRIECCDRGHVASKVFIFGPLQKTCADSWLVLQWGRDCLRGWVAGGGCRTSGARALGFLLPAVGGPVSPSPQMQCQPPGLQRDLGELHLHEAFGGKEFIQPPFPLSVF